MRNIFKSFRATNGNVNMGLGGPMKNPRESTTNVHDWVWLGRATLERAATYTSGRSPPVNQNNNINNNNMSDIRITENPFGSDELGTCFENPKHVELPSAGVVDTSTYCKSSSGRRYSNGKENFDELWKM